MVANLTLTNSANSLTLENGQSLTMEGGGGSTISNAGSILLNGGGGSSAFLILDANTTLQGGGTLTLSATASGDGGNAYIEQFGGVGLTLTNVNNTIQGAGVIGNGGLALNNAGTINANVIGQGLLLNGSGGVTNTKLLEASSGGILQINGVTVNNGGGNITANIASTVQLFGSAVVQGGTLNNSGKGATLGTPYGQTATLDGSTQGPLTINGTYTSALGSNTFVLGTITNKGNIQVNGGSGSQTYLILNANTTLQGGGTVTLSSTASGGGGNAYIEQFGGVGLTLTNVNNTIQGAGVIGNGGLALNNAGTINANANGQGLLLNGSGGVTNTKLLEASGGGILQISGVTVNNSGEHHGQHHGQHGGTVQLVGSTTVQGGTLNNNGGTLGTPSGQTAYLDGSTQGPLTINGTYTSDLGSRYLPSGDDQQQQQLPVERGEWQPRFDSVHRQQQCDAARRGHSDAVHRKRRRQCHHRAGYWRLDPDQCQQHHPGSGHHRQ